MIQEPKPNTPEWFEYQYNPRVTVKDAGLIIPEWRHRALITREKHPPYSDIKYGAHPRENYDLFRAPNAKATLVYIHGGYWRMLSKLETTWVAQAYVEQGISVALINYPLCPDVPLPHIRASAIQAFAHLWRETLTDQEKQTVVVSGHSAGGHLAALHLATDWTALNLPADPIAAVVSLSGVFDVAPLVHTTMNAELKLTAESAAPLNLHRAPRLLSSKLLLAVGAQEPTEFHQQSRTLASHWQPANPGYVSVEGANHFTIVDAFADPGSVLHNQTRAMLSVA
jgi:arylformamidase